MEGPARKKRLISTARLKQRAICLQLLPYAWSGTRALFIVVCLPLTCIVWHCACLIGVCQAAEYVRKFIMQGGAERARNDKRRAECRTLVAVYERLLILRTGSPLKLEGHNCVDGRAVGPACSKPASAV